MIGRVMYAACDPPLLQDVHQCFPPTSRDSNHISKRKRLLQVPLQQCDPPHARQPLVVETHNLPLAPQELIVSSHLREPDSRIDITHVTTIALRRDLVISARRKPPVPSVAGYS